MLHACLLAQIFEHTENLRRVEYLQDGPSPLGLVGGVATIGVLHFQQLSKGVQRCTNNVVCKRSGACIVHEERDDRIMVCTNVT